MKEAGSGRYTMEEIYKATKNFSPSLKIGQGGFGMVYKGCLEDGTLVAVKRVKTVGVQLVSVLSLLNASYFRMYPN